MNLFYAGKLQAMPARYTTDDGRFEVIRPLMGCPEADIAAGPAPHVRPPGDAPPRARHAAAEPVRASPGRLPILGGD